MSHQYRGSDRGANINGGASFLTARINGRVTSRQGAMDGSGSSITGYNDFGKYIYLIMIN